MKIFVTGNKNLLKKDMMQFMHKVNTAFADGGIDKTAPIEILRGASPGTEVLMAKAAAGSRWPVTQVLPSEEKWGNKSRLVANDELIGMMDVSIVVDDPEDDFVQKTLQAIRKSGKQLVVIQW